MKKFHLIWLLSVLSAPVVAQGVRLQGHVAESAGDGLPSAHILIGPDSVHLVADVTGRFSKTLSPGIKTITVSYVGYKTWTRRIRLMRDTTLLIRMIPAVNQLQEVEVIGQRQLQQDVVQSNRTSTYRLTQEDVRMLPTLGGEADVIKVLQLLPGMVRGVEGSSDLFVRGGAADQNLVLLDDVPIYNPSHMLGFLSVFNPDILSTVESINGGFPAQFGGRLSSILNIETVDRLANQTHVSADVGLIASRIFVEQPLVKEKASVWVAARRTYIDQVVKAVSTDELPYYFYDINGKLIFKPSSRDRVELSYYTGIDELELFRDRNNDGDGFLTAYNAGNTSLSAQWNHVVNNRWNTRLSLMRALYQYDIRNAFEENELSARSDIEDYGIRFQVHGDSVWGGAITTGVDWIRHDVSPNVINAQGGFASFFESGSTPAQAVQEVAAYTQYDWRMQQRWQFSTGLRLSLAAVRRTTYINPEPRLSIRYALGDQQALKFSYARMVQYMHRISNTAVTSPTDIWYPVTATIRPQRAHQVALAWQRHWDKHQVLLSLEGYYKSMDNLIGYEEGTNLFLNNDFTSKLIQGRGRAYGIEVLLRKDAGRLTGWISYTIAWSWRQFDQINQGQWFHARYDRRHNGALVLQYALSPRWSLSGVWEYISGSRFTPVIGQYTVLAPTLTGVDLVPIYADINSVKLADSHRLDVGIKFRAKPERRIQWQWYAGVYNVYNRANPIGITIEADEATNTLRYEQPGLFGLIPFISYGIRF